ncbi:cobaltochelatase subunit CobN [Rhizobium wenxiniae]|uniref:cobaltochelatase subunit CobN n=1 Tax=Rhizobium wenxiniae TaxID=1737357 RepID=UPI001C6DD6EC|nr:cobaltochelatase subunit CobN [Rhizobium wenxiniae]MBW9088216.1 cobaltochelatase subunit CobN [Rhizobium wenxiniae]
MHILATTSSSLDDLIEPVDLNQSPADVVVLSFSGSDLNGIAAAWGSTEGGGLDTPLWPTGHLPLKGGDQQDAPTSSNSQHLNGAKPRLESISPLLGEIPGRAEGSNASHNDNSPSLTLTNLSDLRHPMSVDLWLEKTAAHAKVILVRILGGYDRWTYGVEELSRLAKRKKIALVMLPGECSMRDERLAAASTVSEETLAGILACFREGGPDNMRLLVQRLAALASGESDVISPAIPMPKAGFYRPGAGIVDLEALTAGFPPDAPHLPILFYRSTLLANDAAPIDALFEALCARGFAPIPIFVSGLKDAEAIAFVEKAIARLRSAAILTTTAFASGTDDRNDTIFDRTGIPVFQIVVATTRREGWMEGRRGLNPADLAMHVVLPELDGRILAGVISFKDGSGSADLANRPEPDRVDQGADRIAAFLRMKMTACAERKIVILMPDYPSAPGRTGYAVGLDVPQSVLSMLREFSRAGYSIDDIPLTARELLDRLDQKTGSLSLDDYAAAPGAIEAWGNAQDDEDLDNGAYRFRAAQFGNVTVALAPDRGRNADRRADYHSPDLPPRHALIAFGQWIRHKLAAHVIVHVGAHGTLEWLPGKTVALSKECFPELLTGGLPVIYPFIVSNPGEAAVAKRRISAVTIGHLPPVLTGAGLSDDEKKLELLVDEYAQADGLDRRRRDRLAKLIVDAARDTTIATDAGVSRDDDPDTALARIDAFLCDLKDFAIKDGQHVFGKVAEGDDDPLRIASAETERQALLDALDGRHIRPGPSGAPARGRRDVMPTGRNLYASDPRTLPTPTAFELGKRAADEILRRYLQDHGDWPKSLVFDLWGSASLRSGGEEVAQVLALMGARPVQDMATGRVTGIEVLAPAQLGRPRVDVTLRISGLFRDMFPALIALLDAAMRAIAAREEAPGDNPLAEEAQKLGSIPPRIFGSAPGTYGSGIEEKLADGSWGEREELGRIYLDATSHAFGGADGEASHVPGQFAGRIGNADLLVHTGDDPGRDLLDGSADVAFIGGFSAAVAALGGKADVIALDTTDPAKPKARSISEAVTRVVRARAVNPRFIAGQMRHGPRGAAELVETVDRLIGFAETTHAIPQSLIDATYDAYLGNEAVREFLIAQNPEGARYMGERFRSALDRGLWHPRRNAVDAELEMLMPPRKGEVA